MKKRIVAGVFFAMALFTAAMPGVALAGDHPIGTPGTPSCHGDTVAYVNAIVRDARKSGAVDFSGMGGYAKYAGLSVKELQAIIDEYCATP